jgi:prepilin-type N-terminal cleavage/methylation domain-containing protein/prepilin-type processing-associated H-X9-DG protein
MKHSRTPSRAFTLVELLVVIAIIGVLVAMTMPAMMAAREAGRRNLCMANMSQIMLGVAGYENSYEYYPAGVINPDGPIRNEAKGLHQGWLIELLPYLDERVAYDQIDRTKSVYDSANEKVRAYRPRVFVCPSEPDDVPGSSNYAGCSNDVEAPIAAGNNGVLFLNSRLRSDDISDGAAHTIFASEKRVFPGDLGWMSGTRATLRNTGLALNSPADETPGVPAPVEDEGDDAAILYVGGFASAHIGGSNVAFGDGRVEFLAEDIELELWHHLGNRADGNLIDLPSVSP